MRVQHLMTEAVVNLRRNVTMTLAAILTITIAATLLGGALMTRYGAKTLQFEVLNRIEVSVYMDQPCGTTGAPANCLTPSEQANIQQTLQQLPQVKSVTYVSSASAYARFRQYFADDPDLLASAPKDSLPSSFEVQLKDPHQFAVIQSAVSQAPGVSTVTDASSDLKALFGFFKKIELGVLIVSLFLLAAASLLIYNAMRVAVFTRRREIGIMRLVGASDAYIQAPFVFEGLVIGAIGSVFAVGLLALARWFIGSATQNSAILRPFGTTATYAHALLPIVVVGVLLPAVASLITLQRHLRV